MGCLRSKTDAVSGEIHVTPRACGGPTRKSSIDRTPAQIVFRFAMQVGMQPLTGTTGPEHMREDLQTFDFELSPEDVRRVENVMQA
jgi:aryl-alcohol dehydrogenase-like predicted oxidoreductase